MTIEGEEVETIISGPGSKKGGASAARHRLLAAEHEAAGCINSTTTNQNTCKQVPSHIIRCS